MFLFTQHAHASWICSVDMERGDMDMKHGHAARTYSMGNQHGHGARTCGMDKQHGDVGIEHGHAILVRYHAEWTCKMEMHDRKATWTYRLDIQLNKQHGQAVWRHGDGDTDMEHEYEEWTCNIGMQSDHAKWTCMMDT